MKRFKLLFSLLAMMTLAVGNVWGAKITDYANIVSGKKYLIGATTSSTDYYLKVNGSSTSTSIAGMASSTKSEATVFVFEGAGTSWTIKFDGTDNYLGLKNSKDNGKVQVVSTAATFTLSNQSDKIRLTIGSYSVQKNNSGAQFGSYGNTQTDVWLEEVAADAPTLSSITASGTPTKTSYEVGQSFDPAGLVVTGTYSDASQKTITDGITWNVTPATLTEGVTSVNVTATVSGITSAAYTVNGLTVSAHVVTPGEYEIVPNNIFFGCDAFTTKPSGFTGATGLQNDITVVYTAASNAYINATQCRMYDGTKMTFSVPLGYEITNIAFTANATNWAGTHTASVGEMTDNKNWAGAANEVTIAFSDKCQCTKITVTYAVSATLTSIIVSGTPTKTDYIDGNSFNPAGLTVTGNYSDGSQKAITEGITWSEPTALTAGQTSVSITATVAGITSTAYEVTGLTVSAPKNLDHISLNTENVTKVFWKGETFNHTNLVVTAHYDDETSATVEPLSVSTPNMTLVGETQTITVSYKEADVTKEATYNIEVKTIANTKETAYTATEAIALVDAGKDLSTPVYVKGTVTSASSIGTYGNSNIFVTDGGEAKFEFYRCLDINNVNFTSDYVVAGDEVIAYGEMTKYNTTYEFKQGCYLVDYVSGGGSIPEYASLAELVAAGAPTVGGNVVKVTLTNEVITNIVSKGIMLLSGSQEVEIYANEEVPVEWEKGGTVSAELECAWKLYNATWELCPTGWSDINYTAPVTYTITCATDIEHGSVSADVVSAAAGVEITLSETHDDGYQLETYSVVDAESNSISVTNGKFIMPASNVVVSASFVERTGSVWATTYTSNVELTTTDGTNVTVSKVKVNGESTEYDALKMGTSSKDGKCKVSLPLGTTKLHFHAVTWSGSDAATLSVKKDGDDTELFGNVIRSNTGLSSNSPYTLVGSPSDDYYCINFGAALTSATDVIFDASVNRFGIYGVNVEKSDVELISIAVSGTPTNTEYDAGDVFNPDGLVVTGTYNIGEPQVITDGIDWAFDPATLTVGTTSVSVVATVNGVSGEAYVVNGLTVTAAPVNAQWVAGEQGYADATAVVGSAIKDAETSVATVTFVKADGSNDPKYYSNGTAVRAYAKNTFTIAALKGFTMTKIVLAFGASDGSNEISADGGAYADGTWTGSADKVVFTIGGTSGHRRIAGITVYYEGEAATPTGIVLTTDHVQKEFAFGEDFNSDNLVVEAVYSDESKEDVTVLAEVVAPDMSAAGTKTVTVNYLTFSNTYEITITAPTAVSSIELTPTSLTIREDKTAQLTATVQPDDAADKRVTWASGNEAVVTVDAEGKLTPVAVGNATITVKSVTNPEVTATCEVTIVAVPETKQYNLVTDASTLKAGDVIVLGCQGKGTVAGELGSNAYLASTDADFVDGVCSAADALEFTLGGSEGAWTLTSSEGQLGAMAAKKMGVDPEKANYVGTWTIAISAESVASITSTGSDYGTIKYNATSPRFLNYASGQTDIEIYRVNTPSAEVEIETDKDASTIANNADVIVKEGGNLIVSSAKTLGDVVVMEGGKITISGTAILTVNSFVIKSTMGAGKSGQVLDVTASNFIITGDAYFDVTLGAGADPDKWHAFAVPFVVDVVNGIYDTDNNKLTNEVNYAVMSYRGDVRAKGQYGWQKCRGMLTPGVMYIMTVDGARETYRMKMNGEFSIASNSLTVNQYASTTGQATDGGWNGIANTQLSYVSVAHNVQVLNPATYTFETKSSSSCNFTVGTPFFYQASANETVLLATLGAGAAYAPRRMETTEIKDMDVTFANNQYTDHLYVSSTAEATNDYQIGQDLAKMTMTGTPTVPQIFAKAYNTGLCMVDVPMVNEEARVALRLYAPQNGEYTLSVSHAVAEVYLMYNDMPVWNLSESAYTLDLEKGNAEGYSLRIRRAPNQTTGLDNINGNGNNIQKIIVDHQVYIIRDGKTFNAIGQQVRF